MVRIPVWKKRFVCVAYIYRLYLTNAMLLYVDLRSECMILSTQFCKLLTTVAILSQLHIMWFNLTGVTSAQFFVGSATFILSDVRSTGSNRYYQLKSDAVVN